MLLVFLNAKSKKEYLDTLSYIKTENFCVIKGDKNENTSHRENSYNSYYQWNICPEYIKCYEKLKISKRNIVKRYNNKFVEENRCSVNICEDVQLPL